MLVDGLWRHEHHNVYSSEDYEWVFFPVLSECGYRELTAAEDVVGLPSYSDHWPSGLCVWNITVAPDHLVQLTIQSFQLGSDEIFGVFYNNEDCRRSQNSSRLEVLEHDEVTGTLQVVTV